MVELLGSHLDDDGAFITITLPKCIVVLTRDELLRGLKRGKLFKRRQAFNARLDQTPAAARARR
jgi:hypothetical protein